MPAWRNWQTRWTQNPVPSRACRFDPGRRYKELRCYFILVFYLKLNRVMADVAKWLTHRIVAPTLVGSIPIIRPNEDSAEFVGSFFYQYFFM